MNDRLELMLKVIFQPRLAVCKGRESKTLDRGCLMGEPITKSLLSIYMGCLRSLSIKLFIRQMGIQRVPRWFYFHIGGDDHMAHGPKRYLEFITELNLRAGFQISSSHVITKRGGRYLQVPFWFDDPEISFLFNKVFNDYSHSPFCDVVKARLLSRVSKPQSSQNETNVAIGKAKELSVALQYIQDISWKRLLRDRFIWRMSDLLPSRHMSGYFALAMMPQPLGGLGLAVDLLEANRYINHVPDAYKFLFYRISEGFGNILEYRHGLRFFRDTRNIVNFQSVELETFLLENFEHSDEKELNLKGEYLAKVKDLENQGIYTIENFVSLIERDFLQEQALKGRSSFRTMSWKQRNIAFFESYITSTPLKNDFVEFKSKVLQKQLLNLIVEDVLSKINTNNCRLFIDTNTDTVFEEQGVFGYEILPASLYQGIRMMKPSFVLPSPLM